MIKWLVEKFSSLITFFFVLFIICFSVAGGIGGYTMFRTIGCIIGAILGLIVGIFLGILAFGLLATIINISDNTNTILLKLNSLQHEKIIKESSSNDSPSEFKICEKCGTKNSLVNLTCQNCGKYF